MKQVPTEQPGVTKVLTLTLSTLFAEDTWLVSLLRLIYRLRGTLVGFTVLLNVCAISARVYSPPHTLPMPQNDPLKTYFREQCDDIPSFIPWLNVWWRQNRDCLQRGLLGRWLPSIYIQCGVNPPLVGCLYSSHDTRACWLWTSVNNLETTHLNAHR